jgi:hypothetical protein
MLDLDDLIKSLARARPVFHSEADFQHSFAWELHRLYVTAEIRLERALHTTLGVLHIDIFCLVGEQSYVFELKYKTRAAAVLVGEEAFVLQDHGAQPLGRYDVLKDVARVETVLSESHALGGYVVLLTNDSAYWSEPRNSMETSAEFSLHDGRRISGELRWAATASAGTKRNREQAIKLAGQYELQWQDYSQIKAQYYSRFRYLVMEVKGPAGSNPRGVLRP